MTIGPDDQSALDELDYRIRTLLPAEYQDSYETAQPVAMGSAGLKYAADGTVAWDQIWGSFCDLAMAGGPPHKGTLLEPGTPAEVEAQPDRFRAVVNEICRGITLVTDLPAGVSPIPGWVRVDCYGEAMAGWLLRAIVMENVAVRAEGRTLDLPASPAFRLEKEIKNVITVIAKTCHYYLGHMPREQKQAIAILFSAMANESSLVAPLWSHAERADAEATASAALAEQIARNTGLRASPHQYAGWLGVECASVAAAVWMMRAVVVSNVLARREGTVLFVPVNPVRDPNGAHVAAVLSRIHTLAAARLRT